MFSCYFIGKMQCRYQLFTIIKISANCLKRFEVMFSVNPAKEPSMTSLPTAKYIQKSETFIKTYKSDIWW